MNRNDCVFVDVTMLALESVKPGMAADSLLLLGVSKYLLTEYVFLGWYVLKKWFHINHFCFLTESWRGGLALKITIKQL